MLPFRRTAFLVGVVVVGSSLVLTFPHSAHAVISDGANAIDLLGQFDETSFTDPVPVYTKSTANNGPNKFGFNDPQGVLIDTSSHRLFVSDRANNRVLIYNLNTNNTLPDKVPDNVLGQSNFYSNTQANTQAGMNSPYGLAYDSTNSRLFVSQNNQNRVTVYDVTAISDGENATNVLGQSTFTASSSANTQAEMNGPVGLAYDSTNSRLFVSQTGNHRVTVYDVSSITDGENATNVLGQSTFTGSSAATTQAGMDTPHDLAYDSTNSRLFVADHNNNRVTVYDVSPISDGENATNVLGQANFTSAVSATTQSGMRFPAGLAYDSTNSRLFVAQKSSERVTVYDVTSISDGENATNVLGQSTFTASSAATTQVGMSSPYGLAYDSTNSRLFVGQEGNNRVTVYDVASITDGENAIDALGQFDETSFTDPVPVYTKSTANNGPNKFGFNTPTGLALDSASHRLFVVDYTNNRVLVYNLNADNTLPNKVPDNVLGQSNFYSNSGAVTQAGVSGPRGLAYDSTNSRLFVSQAGGNRVTVYDVSSISDGENAVNVLGQANFTSSSPATTQAGMDSTYGLAYDSTNSRLFVSEYDNNRVTVYDVSSITNGENATSVLGQANFTSSSAATTQSGMDRPYGLAYDSTNSRLFVGDYGNNRVTVYDVSSITDGENATNVLGQSTFTASSAATTQARINGVWGVVYDSANSRLFVSQVGGNRVTVYDVASISDGENAVNVLGQANFTSSSAAATQAGMSFPSSFAYDSTNSRLFVGDYNNNRVTVYDAGVATSISGTVYSDEGTTALGSVTVAVSINGAAAAATADTNGSGAYTLSGLSISAGDVLTLYLDGETQDAVTVTKGTGSAMTGIDLYQDHLITRCDNSSCSLTNANLETAETNADADIAAIYSVASSNLTVASGKELLIPSSHTFAPGGNVTTPTFDLRGTYTHSTETVTISTAYQQSAGTFSASSGTVDINGNFTLTGGTHYATSGTFTISGNYSNASGTFTHNSGTLTLDGTSDQTITTAGQAFNNLAINNTGSSGSDDIIISGALDIDGSLTITDGDLDVSTNDPNVNIAADTTIGASGTIDNSAYSGTWTFDGTGTDTLTDNTTSGTNFRAVTVDGSSSKLIQFSSGVNTPTLTFTTLTIGADDTVSFNGENTTITTLVNNNNLRLIGSETVSITTMDTDSGTTTYVGTDTYSQLAAGDSYYHLTLNGSGGSWTMDAALDVNGTLTISAGTLATGNNAITLAGDWSNSGTFTEGTGTVTFDGTGAQALNGETFYNLTINNSAASPSDSVDVDSSAAVTVTNTLTVTDGQFSPTTASDFAAITIGANGILKPDSSASITVSGNWSNSGTFTANSGTVTFDGASQTLSGSSTFYNFSKTEGANDSADETLTFTAGTTQTITNTLTLDGRDANDQINLVSSSPGTVWSINPQGTRTLDYIDVTDSTNTNATAIDCTASNCTNGGNNTNWTFPSSNTAPTASSIRSISQATDGSGDVTFVVDVTDTNGDKTQLKVEYSRDGNNWNDFYLGSVATSLGSASLQNEQEYQIQSIDTDEGKVTLTIIWKSKEQIEDSRDSSVYLRVTPYDGTDTGTVVASDGFTVDNTPQVSSPTPTPTTIPSPTSTPIASPSPNPIPTPSPIPAPTASPEPTPLPVIVLCDAGFTEIGGVCVADATSIGPSDGSNNSQLQNTSGEEDGDDEIVQESIVSVTSSFLSALRATTSTVVSSALERIERASTVVPQQASFQSTLAATAAVATAASVGAIASVPGTVVNIWYVLGRLGQGVVGIAATRRGRPWGRVIDSTSGTPVPQVIIRVLDGQTQAIRDTIVTDEQGEFATILAPGSYYLQVVKPGWHMVMGEHWYDGGVVAIEREQLASLVIAMQPESNTAPAHLVMRNLIQRLERVMAVLSWPLLLGGFGISVIVCIGVTSLLNISILGIYIALICFKYLFHLYHQQAVGHVHDDAGKPVDMALVQLYEEKYWRQVATRVTTTNGQFVLLPSPGTYTIVVSKDGYEQYRKSHVVVQPGNNRAVSLSFTLTPQAPRQLHVAL